MSQEPFESVPDPLSGGHSEEKGLRWHTMALGNQGDSAVVHVTVVMLDRAPAEGDDELAATLAKMAVWNIRRALEEDV